MAVLPTLRALAELDMSGCGLGVLPAPVAAMSTLQTLLLAHNHLSVVTDLLGGAWLSRLVRLSLDYQQRLVEEGRFCQ